MLQDNEIICLWEMSLNLESFPTQMINSMRRSKNELSFPTHVPTVKKLIKKLLWQNKKRAEDRERNRVKGTASNMKQKGKPLD